MYESVKNPPRERKDRLLVVLLLAAFVLIASVTPPICIALKASYSYHHFVLDFSNDLVYARRSGGVTLTENGETKEISADAVSSMFVSLTDCGFGTLLKTAPDAPNVVLTLPDGTTLTLFNTPENTDNIIPRGVTVSYAPAGDKKPILYLQRELRYEDAVSLLHAGI